MKDENHSEAAAVAFAPAHAAEVAAAEIPANGTNGEPNIAPKANPRSGVHIRMQNQKRIEEAIFMIRFSNQVGYHQVFLQA